MKELSDLVANLSNYGMNQPKEMGLFIKLYSEWAKWSDRDDLDRLSNLIKDLNQRGINKDIEIGVFVLLIVSQLKKICVVGSPVFDVDYLVESKLSLEEQEEYHNIASTLEEVFNSIFTMP